MKTAVVLILAIIAQTAGGVVLSKGMKGIASGELDGGVSVVALRAIENPAIWVGTALLILFFVLYAAALSWADLSFVLPATSFGYVLNVACGYYFLNEAVSPARWAGSLLIFAGVFLVSKSGVRSTEGLQALEMPDRMAQR